MAKRNTASRLVRSDYRLLALGLFSASLLLAVFGVFSPNMFNLLSMDAKKTTVVERMIKVEEAPAKFGSNIQNVDKSYAAEQSEQMNTMSPTPYPYKR